MLKTVYFTDGKKLAQKAMVREEDVQHFVDMGATTEEVDHRESPKFTTVWWSANNVHGNHKAIVGTRSVRFFEDFGASEFLEDLKPYVEPEKETKKETKSKDPLLKGAKLK